MRPEKLSLIDEKGSPEERIFTGTRRLLHIRKNLPVTADLSNLVWLNPNNIHVACFMRKTGDKQLYGLFNFSGRKSFISWFVFKQAGIHPKRLFDHWMGHHYDVGEDHEYFVLEPFSFCLMESLI
jgi:amylosucrase